MSDAMAIVSEQAIRRCDEAADPKFQWRKARCEDLDLEGKWPNVRRRREPALRVIREAGVAIGAPQADRVRMDGVRFGERHQSWLHDFAGDYIASYARVERF